MLMLPIQLGDDAEYTLVVVLESDNLERLKQADPAEFHFSKMGEPWVHLRPKAVMIAYADPADIETFKVILDEKGPMQALRFLARGFRYRPEEGDHDHDYLRKVKPNEGIDKC